LVGRFRATAIRGLSSPLPAGDIDRAIREGRGGVCADESNLIVDAALDSVTALLAGGYGMPTVYGGTIQDFEAAPSGDTSISSLFITEMRVTDPASPAEPLPGDTTIDETGTVVVFRSPGTGAAPGTLTPTYNPGGGRGVLRLSAVIGPTDYNGVTFTEEGLFTNHSTPKLFARALFGRKARGTIEFVGTPSAGETITIDDDSPGAPPGGHRQLFTFVASPPDPPDPNQIVIGPLGSMAGALISGIESTILNVAARSVLGGNPTVEVIADSVGAAFNQPMSSASPAIKLSGLSGGIDPPTKGAGIGIQLDHTITVIRGTA